MSWDDQGGPWGKGNNNPWKNKDLNKNIDDLLKKFKKGFNGGDKPIKTPQFTKKTFSVGLGIGLFVWLSSGFYTVNTDEQAAIMRFGAYVRTALPGLNYHLPAPIEKVFKAPVSKVNRLDSGTQVSNTKKDSSLPEDIMLTGDENLVHVRFAVLWQIKDIKNFLFDTRNPEQVIKVAAESAVREIVGQTEVDPIVSGSGWSEINQKALALLQKLIDDYGVGAQVISIELQSARPPQEVSDAFVDVQRARANYAEEINKAKAYENDIIPRARAVKISRIENAIATKNKLIAAAQGLAERFTLLQKEVSKAPSIMMTQIFNETMEDIFIKNKITVIDPKIGNVLPHFPLNPSTKSKKNDAPTDQEKK